MEFEPHHRTEDKNPLHITREIPLPWLIGCALAICAQAILMWAGQREQASSLVALSVQVSEQTKQINTLVERVSSSVVKDVEHDLLIRDLSRRMSELEGALRSRK